MLYEKIKIYLSQNNINVSDVTQYFTLKDLSDGQGAFIDNWDESNIGISQPTQEQFDNITEAFIFLQEAKNNKIAEIQTAKEIDLYLNVSYNNKDFISSEKAVSNMTGAIILNQDSYNWLDANGNPNIMTVNDLKNLIGIIATQRSLIYNKEALKIKAVNDAQTIEDVNNINWENNLSLGLKTKKKIKTKTTIKSI